MAAIPPPEVPFWIKLALPVATGIFGAFAVFVKPKRTVSVGWGVSKEVFTFWAFVALASVLVTNGLNVLTTKMSYEYDQFQRTESARKSKEQLLAQQKTTNEILGRLSDQLAIAKKSQGRLEAVSGSLTDATVKLGQLRESSSTTIAGVRESVRRAAQLSEKTGAIATGMASTLNKQDRLFEGQRQSWAALTRSSHPIQPVSVLIARTCSLDSAAGREWIRKLEQEVKKDYPPPHYEPMSDGIGIMYDQQGNLSSLMLDRRADFVTRMPRAPELEFDQLRAKYTVEIEPPPPTASANHWQVVNYIRGLDKLKLDVNEHLTTGDVDRFRLHVNVRGKFAWVSFQTRHVSVSGGAGRILSIYDLPGCSLSMSVEESETLSALWLTCGSSSKHVFKFEDQVLEPKNHGISLQLRDSLLFGLFIPQDPALLRYWPPKSSAKGKTQTKPKK